MCLYGLLLSGARKGRGTESPGMLVCTPPPPAQEKRKGGKRTDRCVVFPSFASP